MNDLFEPCASVKLVNLQKRKRMLNKSLKNSLNDTNRLWKWHETLLNSIIFEFQKMSKSANGVIFSLDFQTLMHFQQRIPLFVKYHVIFVHKTDFVTLALHLFCREAMSKIDWNQHISFEIYFFDAWAVLKVLLRHPKIPHFPSVAKIISCFEPLKSGNFVDLLAFISWTILIRQSKLNKVLWDLIYCRIVPWFVLKKLTKFWQKCEFCLHKTEFMPSVLSIVDAACILERNISENFLETVTTETLDKLKRCINRLCKAEY